MEICEFWEMKIKYKVTCLKRERNIKDIMNDIYRGGKLLEEGESREGEYRIDIKKCLRG